MNGVDALHFAAPGRPVECGAAGPATPDEWDVTCRDCRAMLIARGVCPDCGQHRLSWGTHPRKKTNVVDGRLSANDVETIFYLACDYCSETLIAQVDPEEVARALTGAKWVPPYFAVRPTLPA